MIYILPGVLDPQLNQCFLSTSFKEATCLNSFLNYHRNQKAANWIARGRVGSRVSFNVIRSKYN